MSAPRQFTGATDDLKIMKRACERSLTNRRDVVTALLIAATMLMTAGCATMLGSREETIYLHCSPSDELVVLVNGNEADLLNGQLELTKQRDTHFVTISRGEYYPSTISFNREVDPVWMIADLLWGPAFPIAWIIDWQSNAIFRIDPRDIHVVLRKKE